MKKILLGATHSVIEPLGLLHLSTIAKQEGYNAKILMAKGGFDKFDETLREYSPQMLGFTVYTGNHLSVFNYLDKIRERGIKVIVGGPHATYFPRESANHADYVVLSEGFNSFRSILKGKTGKGIVHLSGREDFPSSDRESFYKDNKEYDDSPIKSVIASTGCPGACTYCYNSSTLDSIEDSLTEFQKEEMSFALRGNKLFPKSLRSIDDVISEVDNIRNISPNTKMIYFQDDIFGADINWVREFTAKYKDKIKMPFHAQLRFEFANPRSEKSKERLDRLRDAGCTGLTLAIESSSPMIREEILNRKMDNGLMFESFEYMAHLGYKVRTEQMLGLPCGATSQETRINLEADLATLELNVKLKEHTGLPTMAWASIFAPYKGTKIGEYCKKHGFYHGRNNDVPETFFKRSVLNFPKNYIGPELVAGMPIWMNEDEQNKYRDNMQMLRDLFSYFSMVPEGHKLAERFIKSKDHSYASLSKNTRHHLYDDVLYDIK